MGLDMWLTAKINLNETFGVNEDREIEVGYWRKANQIHKWFVDNVQFGEDDCKEYEVSLDKLMSLRDLCKEVLNDEFYFEDIKHTIDILNNIETNELTPISKFYYNSSW